MPGGPAARHHPCEGDRDQADLNDILARLAAHGIGHEPVETYGNGVRHVEVLDPDGNSLSLAEVPA